jgi:NAD(P)-dependent dehydrogenase (short-subunit alcohol dehydrogenase family)
MNSIFNLKGKIVVITGGAGLLGQKHAEAVAEYGAIPIILDLSLEKSLEVAARINEEYQTGALGLSVDITKENEVRQACETVQKKVGKIDVLINNAANNPKVEESKDGKNFSRLENFDLNVWNQDIAVGLTGAFLCAKHFGHAISQNPDGGAIINISSDLGVIAPDQRLYRKAGLPDELQPVKPVTYSVVKTGLIGLTRYLATYWPKQKVRCNALCPGGVFNQQDEAFLKEVCARIPLGRMAQHDEYKGAIVFLASDASVYMNGAVLNMDGGRSSW